MIRAKVEKRIDQYLDLLARHRYQVIEQMDLEYAQSEMTMGEHVPDGPWQAITLPFDYREMWVDHWFRGVVTLPDDGGVLSLQLETETDTLVFIDGVPYGATNPFHPRLDVTAFAGQRITVVMQAWGGHRYPGYHPSDGGRVQACVAIHKRDYPLTCKAPVLLKRNDDVYELYYDVKALRQVSKTLDPLSYHYQYLLTSLLNALDSLSLVESPVSGAQAVRAAIAPLLAAKNGTLSPQVLSVGYAHLDHAWLWPISETVRKAARTALNMCRFIEEDQDFVYVCTQPAQMEALKEHYPTVFSRVREAWRSGRWEPNGVCYVEPDCMLPSGESLIRQNLIGRRVTAELFDGYRGDVFWLPDSFGYTASLPQILVGCGVKYFVTSKLSWNDTTRFPYDSFLWESLDGTRIPAFMIQGSYTGSMDPVDITHAYASVLHKETQETLLRPIGEGDGGGGTMHSDLALMRRQRDLQGAPKNRWSTVSGALERIFCDVSALPVYTGELYLELHRGTYTSQARLKRYNRHLENLLASYEYLSALRFVQGDDVSSLLSALDAAWRIVLVNQFHDILPGSSITIVNREAEASYERALKLLTTAFVPLAGPYLLNTTGLAHHLPDGGKLGSFETMEAPLQEAGIERGAGSELAADWGTVTLDREGGITSIRLAGGRELVERGRVMNELTIGEDYPVYWDAWDIDEDVYAKQRRLDAPHTVRCRETEHCWMIESVYHFSHSTLEQTMTCFKRLAKIEFATTVDWQERHRLLRVNFPTTISTDRALFDVPFGIISRSTTSNLPFDRARFEVPAHKWAALQDSAVTVAVASDSKYGYRAKGTELSLSLLRSPEAPDPEADLGSHRFTYALLCSTEGLLPIQEESAALNRNLLAVDSRYKPLVTVHGGSVMAETVKVSEDRMRVVVRLREWSGAPCTVHYQWAASLDPDTVIAANMIEEADAHIDCFAFRPFEVKTLLVERRIVDES